MQAVSGRRMYGRTLPEHLDALGFLPAHRFARAERLVNAFVQGAVTTIMSSKAWTENSVIFILTDENALSTHLFGSGAHPCRNAIRFLD